MSNLLSLITFIPLVAAIILALVARSDSESASRNVKILTMSATVFTFVVSLFVLFDSDVLDHRNLGWKRAYLRIL